MERKIENIYEKSNLSPLGIILLTFLSRHPEEEFYTKDLAGRIDGSVSGCHSALAGLLTDELVHRRKDGGNVYWKAKMDNPSIVNFKVFINIQQLRGILGRIKDLSRKVVLFGSCATGMDTHRSDIDLLVVTNESDTVSNLLRDIRVDGRPLSPLMMTPSRLFEIKDDDRALYEEVRAGITLWDGDHH
jgi:hypothetical protein